MSTFLSSGSMQSKSHWAKGIEIMFRVNVKHKTCTCNTIVMLLSQKLLSWDKYRQLVAYVEAILTCFIHNNEEFKDPYTLSAVNLMSPLLLLLLFSFQSADTGQDVVDIVDLQVSVICRQHSRRYINKSTSKSIHRVRKPSDRTNTLDWKNKVSKQATIQWFSGKE